MSRDYSIKKIKEILHATRGNIAQAQKMVIAQALDDPKLLRELVQPHMVGIVAHAVNRVVSGKADNDINPQKEGGSLGGPDSFGLDILKAIAGGEAAQFGQESYARPVKKQGASQRHVDAILQMIKKNKDK